MRSADGLKIPHVAIRVDADDALRRGVHDGTHDARLGVLHEPVADVAAMPPMPSSASPSRTAKTAELAVEQGPVGALEAGDLAAGHRFAAREPPHPCLRGARSSGCTKASTAERPATVARVMANIRSAASLRNTMRASASVVTTASITLATTAASSAVSRSAVTFSTCTSVVASSSFRARQRRLRSAPSGR